MSCEPRAYCCKESNTLPGGRRRHQIQNDGNWFPKNYASLQRKNENQQLPGGFSYWIWSLRICLEGEKAENCVCIPQRYIAEVFNKCNQPEFPKVTGKDPGPTGEFAMKKIDLALSEIPDVWKERDLLVYLKHERISQIVGSFYESDVFFVMELCYGNKS